MTKELGRLSAEEMKQAKHDAPNSSVMAIHTKLDEVIDALKGLAAKMDADGVGGSDYVANITGGLEKIKLHL